MNLPLKPSAESSTQPSLAQSVCVDCGLCCDGSIFEDVELKDVHEADSMEIMGLETEEEEGKYLLVQPCNALSGTQCGLYPHRPECCRTFECHLLNRLKAGDITKTKALSIIQNIRTQLANDHKDEARIMIEKELLNLRS